MARFRIIVLDQVEPQTFRVAMWADVPVARQSFYAQPLGSVSAWKDALASDNSNLVSGLVAEEVRTFSVEPGTTLVQARLQMQSLWTQFQSRVTNQNPWARYGATWDGVAWTAGGVA